MQGGMGDVFWWTKTPISMLLVWSRCTWAGTESSTWTRRRCIRIMSSQGVSRSTCLGAWENAVRLLSLVRAHIPDINPAPVSSDHVLVNSIKSPISHRHPNWTVTKSIRKTQSNSLQINHKICNKLKYTMQFQTIMQLKPQYKRNSPRC